MFCVSKNDYNFTVVDFLRPQLVCWRTFSDGLLSCLKTLKLNSNVEKLICHVHADKFHLYFLYFILYPFVLQSVKRVRVSLPAAGVSTAEFYSPASRGKRHGKLALFSLIFVGLLRVAVCHCCLAAAIIRDGEQVPGEGSNAHRATVS